MSRLADSTLPEVSAARPGYDRSQTRPGIVHLGLGAFARAHLAVYADALLARGERDYGIIAVSLRSDDVRRALEPQDGLYTLAVVDGPRIACRVVGSVCSVLHAPSQDAAVRDALAAANTALVTVTVTEKGYCGDPATRRLDLAHPDIAHDLGHPDAPRSLAGYLVRAARDRRAAGGRPLTVLSLDNLPANGQVLASAVRDLAGAAEPGLVGWIEDNLAFPSSMVDRMVPATDDALRAAVGAAIGVDDAWPVRAEPYSQWVAEGEWATAMPPLAEIGVQVVDDVAPWERLKLRVLNALHTAAAHYGLYHGRDTVDTVVADPGGAGLLARVAAEIVEVLEAPPEVDVDGYVGTTLGRFANSGLGHRCAQIATDTSQKLPQRLLDTTRLRLAHGLPIDAIADVLALWAWSTLGRDHLGRPRRVDDPLAVTYAELAAAGADAPALTTALVGLEPVFGDLVGSATLVTAITPRLARLIR